MNKKGQWWIWTQVGLWSIAVLIIIFGTLSIIWSSKIAVTMQVQGKEITDNLQKTNALLEEYQKLPTQIKDINDKIIILQNKTDSLIIDNKKLNENEAAIQKDVESLNIILISLEKSQKNIAALQDRYPPVQMQNIMFQNLSKDEANTFIKNAINQRSWNLGVTFAFGSLIGISVTLLPIYFIYKKYYKKK
jgi:septal ring factor EnvC (AmiA/AmiB activator)